MQVDQGRVFMGELSQLLKARKVKIRRGRVKVYRDQGRVGRFNRALAERIFGHQYEVEFLLAVRGLSVRRRKWVKVLPEVICTLNNKTTHDRDETIRGDKG